MDNEIKKDIYVIKSKNLHLYIIDLRDICIVEIFLCSGLKSSIPGAYNGIQKSAPSRGLLLPSLFIL